MRNEGSEPDLREQLDGCIWQLLAAEEWETLLLKWVLWISEGIGRPGVVEANTGTKLAEIGVYGDRTGSGPARAHL